VSQWKAKNHIPKAHVMFLRDRKPELFQIQASDPPEQGRAAA
jgi:hypothetical protein